MRRHETSVDVLGPWSLSTSRAFWEGFSPAALPVRDDLEQWGGTEQRGTEQLSTVFRVEADWSRAEAIVTQHDRTAHLRLTGDGELQAAAAQVGRFLSLDVDARGWPAVADRDPVIADAQARLPGLRPCGFHSPYEAAVWAVLSQRTRIAQAARLREDLVRHQGEDGAFLAPQALRALELDLPGRKSDYLHAVADAALEGRLDAALLRSLDPHEAIAAVQDVRGLGPFAAELVVIRGANAPDVLPATNTASTRRSPSATAPTSTSLRSLRAGDHSGPGPACTCVPCASCVPGRSVVTRARLPVSAPRRLSKAAPRRRRRSSPAKPTRAGRRPQSTRPPAPSAGQHTC